MTQFPTVLTQPRTGPPQHDSALPGLRAKAAQLEAAFLAEMLGHAGLDADAEAFGGGIGEEQFSSFLRQEQASAIVKSGGIGLTEALFRALSNKVEAEDHAAK